MTSRSDFALFGSTISAGYAAANALQTYCQQTDIASPIAKLLMCEGDELVQKRLARLLIPLIPRTAPLFFEEFAWKVFKVGVLGGVGLGLSTILLRYGMDHIDGKKSLGEILGHGGLDLGICGFSAGASGLLAAMIMSRFPMSGNAGLVSLATSFVAGGALNFGFSFIKDHFLPQKA